MTVGQAYADLLTSREQQALANGCAILIDQVFADLEDIHEPQDVVHSKLFAHLPARYLSKYTPLFCRQFAVCIITVAWKVAQSHRVPLSLVAEELAAWAIITEAKNIIEEEKGEKAAEQAFDPFVDGYVENTDFVFLFDDASDGIDEGVIGQLTGMSSLRFDDWFVPFSDEPARTAHPYVLPDSSPF
ncbi:MAG TPA: hypothetical protein VNE61_07500 [Ktedonobacteraceae bacterium]|nr:hypothetical protein [Ktedonobacteraceae bacterium]